MENMQEIPDVLLSQYNWKMLGDYFCPVWEKENGPIANEIANDFFKFPDSIQYKTLKEPTGKKENASEILPHILSKPEKDYKQSILAESGYLRPHFRFVSKRVFPIKEEVDNRVRDLKKVQDKNEEMEVLNSLTTYRDSLLTQIQRQASKVDELNRQIANILKVYYNETVDAIKSEPELNQKEKQLGHFTEILRVLFKEGILKGGYPEDIKQFTKELKINDYIHQSLNDRIIYGIDYLVEKRESYLEVSTMLAQKINHLESIIEILINGDELTGIYFKRRNMPDPATVAKTIKGGEYATMIIEEAMSITREYILEEELDDVYGHIESIKRIIEADGISDPSKNTIRNWIKIYCEKCGVLS